MCSIGRDSTQSTAEPQNVQSDQRNNLFDLGLLTPASFQETVRKRVWILRILIFLFVLNRNLNQSMAQEKKTIFIEERIARNPAQKFNYFTLQLSWPPTYCGKAFTGEKGFKKGQSEPRLPPEQQEVVDKKRLKDYQDCREKLTELHSDPDDQFRFTIHGFWPSWDGVDGTEPLDCDCDKREFDEEILNLKPGDINKYWPSLDSALPEANKIFWEQEWKRHGVCAAHIDSKKPKFRMTSCLQYFDRALKLAIKLDPLQKEFKKRYEANTEQKLEYQVMRDFLVRENLNHKKTQNFGVRLNFHQFKTVPKQKGGGFEDEFWLEGIQICFHTNFEKMDCPRRLIDREAKTIIIPTGESLKRLISKARKKELNKIRKTEASRIRI